MFGASRTLTESELVEARQALRALHSTHADSLRLRVLEGGAERDVAIPASVLEPLLEILTLLSRGEEPAVLSRDEELTTQEAADIINVSRPTLVRLLEEGKIPFYRIGSHRRLRMSDLLKYREERDRASIEALRQLAEEEEALGLRS